MSDKEITIVQFGSGIPTELNPAAGSIASFTDANTGVTRYITKADVEQAQKDELQQRQQNPTNRTIKVQTNERSEVQFGYGGKFANDKRALENARDQLQRDFDALHDPETKQLLPGTATLHRLDLLKMREATLNRAIEVHHWQKSEHERQLKAGLTETERDGLSAELKQLEAIERTHLIDEERDISGNLTIRLRERRYPL